MEKTLPITPSILTWARERAGYSIDDLLKTFPKIQDWENGKSCPTYRQLENLAKKFNCVMAIFFFPDPPNIDPVHSDFRTLPDSERLRLSPEMIKMLKKAKVYQYNIAELMDGTQFSGESPINKIRLSSSNVELVAQNLREILSVTIEEQANWQDSDFALKVWRDKIENLNIFIFKDAFRDNDYSGFCLYHSKYPLIYVNNSNSKNRQIFTLFHELAHLLFQTGGIDKTNQDYVQFLSDDDVEVLCNSFASSFLVPTEHFRSTFLSLEVNDKNIRDIANFYCVSRDVILRRYYNAKKISKLFYQNKLNEYGKEYIETKKAKKANGGGNYYATQGSYICQPYAKMAFQSYYNKEINEGQLSEYLNIKPKSLPSFEETLLKSMAT